MESEHADLLDRKAMALYGVATEKLKSQLAINTFLNKRERRNSIITENK